MKISARNVFKGKIKKIFPGVVNCEVVIEIAKGIEIVSVITKGSAENLGLKVGMDAHAVVKSSSVMVAVD